MENNGYFPVIGLEVHVELKTVSKMFCGCPAAFGSAPNQNICPVCTGQPGSLPVINRKAIETAIKAAVALNCRISGTSIFARKNYFYPDLPKNYQISQYEQPLGENGFLEINGRNISIKRVHIEEDTGKLLHSIGSRELEYSLVDFNRSGIPLMEIVSEPDIFSVQDAYEYLSKIKNILKYADISECDMENGTLRCDANISILKVETDKQAGINGRPLGTKTEIKNLNSFKAVKEALSFEFDRQVNAIKQNEKIIQETRLWNDKTKSTALMRSKEEAHDYRYFPEPDLLPMAFTGEYINMLGRTIPELPEYRKRRFVEKYGLSEYDAEVLTSEKPLADYYEKVIDGNESVAADAASWVMTELMGRLNSAGKTIKETSVAPESLAALITLIRNNTISGKIAKTVLENMFETGERPEKIIKEQGLLQISDEESISRLIEEVLRENKKAADEFRAGKKQALGALIGAAMKKTDGRVNPQILNKKLKEILI